jgi:hypothetical protein
MKVRISNANARGYVQRLKEFKANNLWSEWVADTNTQNQTEDARYVVYSYDRHWPLFIYEARIDAWFANASKYGVTTSKHKTQSHPLIGSDEKLCITLLHVDDMIKVANNGVVGIITGIGETA